MRTRTILAALGTGVLAALTLSAPASATGPTSSPAVDWKALCDSAGSISVTFTAPTEANKDNHVSVGVADPAGLVQQGELPTATGERTITFKFANTAALTAKWHNGGTAGFTAGFADTEANAHYTWALPDSCKPTVEVVKPTCAIPYLSVVVSNPVGAQPINLTVNGSTRQLDGGENDGILKTSKTVTYSYVGIGGLAPYITGGATIDYAPPSGCGADTPGGQQVVPPQDGTHHHGKGRFDPKTIVVVVTGAATTTAPAGAVTTTTTKKAAAAGKGDNLAVTGSNTKAIVGVGFLLFAGGLVLLLAIRRRRQVRFTA